MGNQVPDHFSHGTQRACGEIVPPPSSPSTSTRARSLGAPDGASRPLGHGRAPQPALLDSHERGRDRRAAHFVDRPSRATSMCSTVETGADYPDRGSTGARRRDPRGFYCAYPAARASPSCPRRSWSATCGGSACSTSCVPYRIQIAEIRGALHAAFPRGTIVYPGNFGTFNWARRP